MIRLMGFLGVELCIGGGGELGIVRVGSCKSCCLFKEFSDGLDGAEQRDGVNGGLKMKIEKSTAPFRL